MKGPTSLFFTPSEPIKSLAALFLAWKGFLLAIALTASLVPDYDTSTSLFFDRAYGAEARVPVLATALTRWDALYFVQSSRRGYVFEQEWAFGAALPRLARVVADALPCCRAVPALEPVVAIGLAHLSHWIAVMALHRLTMVISADAERALVVSALHIVSPAGLFLSAPYAESPFAALSFIGFLLFAVGIKIECRRTLATVCAGLVLGLATAFRSNGLANGLLFAVEALDCFANLARRPSVGSSLALVASLVGGVCVALGSAIPQAVAWRRFCLDSSPGLEPRPWCSRTLPSIYTYVQGHYWNVGFLRYWTLNQLPLFLLATPMLTILISSGLAVLRNPLSVLKSVECRPPEDYRKFVRTLAAVQVLVAALAITNYHVQVISRLSSGFPVWYWWVADCIIDRRKQTRGRAMVVFMIMYAGVQGGLFACFLPPA
ncbi:hypothetical protein L249_8545 [Ophiocordyceps polyrhachis-furcata BCC 54312]|uniref:GPI mannosyltransferase 2 n=1 Tax=Ophiocordyceps polyrhachis-furcata BCC 54312 TaxID=1330021 RepID=A0A367L6M1_9HYPO|nr:hypothetical protein L249_8545 [Ophiocordyceps polyrhachis-furcata BCC 54312]